MCEWIRKPTKHGRTHTKTTTVKYVCQNNNTWKHPNVHLSKHPSDSSWKQPKKIHILYNKIHLSSTKTLRTSNSNKMCTPKHQTKMYFRTPQNDPLVKIPNKMHFRQNAQQNSLHVQQNIRHNTRVSTPETKKNSSNNTNTSEVKAASNMLHIYYKKKHKNWENILLRREAVFLLPRWTADRAFWQVELTPLHSVRITMWADILVMSEMLNRRTIPQFEWIYALF